MPGLTVTYDIMDKVESTTHASVYRFSDFFVKQLVGTG